MTALELQALQCELAQLRHEVVYLREQNERLRQELKELEPEYSSNDNVPDLICGNCYGIVPCNCDFRK